MPPNRDRGNDEGPGRDPLLDLPLGSREEEPSPEEETATGAPPAASSQPPFWRRYGWLVAAAAGLLALGVAVGLLWPRGTPAVARLSVPLLDFGEQRVAAEGTPREVVLSNGGTRSLTVESVALVGEGPEDFRLVADGCTGRVLDDEGQCTVLVGFEPTGSPGARSAALEVVGPFSNSPLQVPLLGTAVTPLLSVDRHRLRFGQQPLETRGAAQRLVVTNRGTAPLVLGRLTLEGSAAGDFRLRSDFCSGRTVPPEARCVVEIAFEPTGEGERRAVLAVTGEGVQPSRVELSGVGTAPPPEPEGEGEGATADEEGLEPGGDGSAEPEEPEERPKLELRSTALDLGEVRVGGSAGGTLRVANTGTGPGTVTAVEMAAAEGAGAESTAEQVGAFSVSGCAGSTLEAGQACTVQVQVRPRRAGAHRARLVVRVERAPGDTGEESEAPLEAVVTATAVAPRLVVRPQRLDLGRVAVTESTERSLTLVNEGSAPLRVARVARAGEAAEDFRVSAGECTAPLAVGSSCRLTVTFSPRVEGPRQARLRLEHDDPRGSTEVELEGFALPEPRPELTVTPRTLRFGDQSVGQRSGIETLRLRNTGTARLNLRRIALVGADAGSFQIVPGTCDGLPFLAPGGDCTVGMRFVPTARGELRARLVIRHDAPDRETAVGLSGRGLSP